MIINELDKVHRACRNFTNPPERPAVKIAWVYPNTAAGAVVVDMECPLRYRLAMSGDTCALATPEQIRGFVEEAAERLRAAVERALKGMAE